MRKRALRLTLEEAEEKDRKIEPMLGLEVYFLAFVYLEGEGIEKGEMGCHYVTEDEFYHSPGPISYTLTDKRLVMSKIPKG